MQTMSDERLAGLAGRGDDAAFAELARRYRSVIGAATRGLPNGLDKDDARQAALLGLWEACRVTGGARCFAALAATLVRWQVIDARRAATTQRHRVLTDALRNTGENSSDVLAAVPAPEANDPARVVELRDRLRERAQITQPREIRPLRGGRQFTDSQVTRALALIAGGALRSEAASAVGVRPYDVQRWLDAPIKAETGADVISLASYRARNARTRDDARRGSGLPGAA